MGPQEQQPGHFAPPQAFLPPIPPPAPPRRRVWWVWVLAAVLALVVTALVIGTTTGPTRPEVPAADADTTTKVVKTSDGRARLTIPTQWRDLPADYTTDDAVLAVGQYYQERYLMVITDDPDDFTDFADFEDQAQDAMDAISPGAVIGQPTPLTLGDLPAVRYEVTGTVDGHDVIYWFTLVEGTRGYHQVVTWTLADRRPTAEPALADVVRTFEEITP